MLFVAAIDLTAGLSLGPDSYQASWYEWLVYGGGSFLIVASYHSVHRSATHRGTSSLSGPSVVEIDVTQVAENDASGLLRWLESDQAAAEDRFSTRSIAERIAHLLRAGTRSVGIIGPFGSGKTTIVQWMKDELKADPQFIITPHSCWKFSTSTSSIHDMLSEAVAKLHQCVDTFPIRSLPDAYRELISASGRPFQLTASILFRQRSVHEQFARLSERLGAMGVTLVIVVEDLDRTDSRTFDVQEVLGFLEQLNEYENLAFVLTGGQTSTERIDFVKLCDHLELIPALSTAAVTEPVAAVRERCLTHPEFQHIHAIDTSQNPWRWDAVSALLMVGEIWEPEALSRLLQTPRALRHVLARTYKAWKHLYGEIDFDELLRINTLRLTAPEAFAFVIRHWDRLHQSPTAFNRITQPSCEFRDALRNNWESSCSLGSFDVEAARVVVDGMLPNTPEWLDGANSAFNDKMQGVVQERYWLRAVREHIDADEVRDQDVLRDTQGWQQSRSADVQLVDRLCSSEEYGEVWSNLAITQFGADRDAVLQLSSQVLDAISRRHEALASGESPGFGAILDVARRCHEPDEEATKWLGKRIRDAARSSLALVRDLWYFWGRGPDSIISRDEKETVRRELIKTLQSTIAKGDDLDRVVHANHRDVLYQLVFDAGANEPLLTGSEHWKWLAPVVLDSVSNKNPTVAILVVSFLMKYGEDAVTADTVRLRDFFGGDSMQLIEGIEQILPQINGSFHQTAAQVINSAKTALSHEENP